MTLEPRPSQRLRVLIAGGGVAALETLLALHELVPERADVSVIAPDSEFVYRPMTVREPFAYAAAARYPLQPIVAAAGGELIADRFGWVDHGRRIAHTEEGREIEYDALVVAMGARLCPRYKNALTIDDRRMDETLHGLIQDIEAGALHSIAYVAPPRMPWPLPLYELALLTAGRAFDMNLELDTTLVTPEERPLAIFGNEVSARVAQRLANANVRTINSARAEIPSPGEIVINPGDRRLRAERVVALPELYGPSVRGLPLSEHGFIDVNRYQRVPNAGLVYAAGDAVDFPVKHGGLGAQMADTVAESIAAFAGADIEPQPFKPLLEGVLLTDEEPLYISARLTAGQAFDSKISDVPPEGGAGKIAARYLAPYLQRLDRESAAASGSTAATAAGA